MITHSPTLTFFSVYTMVEPSTSKVPGLASLPPGLLPIQCNLPSLHHTVPTSSPPLLVLPTFEVPHLHSHAFPFLLVPHNMPSLFGCPSSLSGLRIRLTCVPYWVLAKHSSFLQQSKDMHVRSIGDPNSQVVLSANLSMKWVCVISDINWVLVFGIASQVLFCSCHCTASNQTWSVSKREHFSLHLLLILTRFNMYLSACFPDMLHAP